MQFSEGTEDTFFVAIVYGSTGGGPGPGPSVGQKFGNWIEENDGPNLFSDHTSKSFVGRHCISS